jgi:hypothetical protein
VGFSVQLQLKTGSFGTSSILELVALGKQRVDTNQIYWFSKQSLKSEHFELTSWIKLNSETPMQ